MPTVAQMVEQIQKASTRLSRAMTRFESTPISTGRRDDARDDALDLVDAIKRDLDGLEEHLRNT